MTRTIYFHRLKIIFYINRSSTQNKRSQNGRVRRNEKHSFLLIFFSNVLEIIKISIPSGKKVERIRNTYLRFILRTRSLNEGNKVDKLKYYGKSYLKTTNEDGSAIEDK